MTADTKAIPNHIRKAAYKLGCDIRHHIAHSEIELIQHDCSMDDMLAKAIHDAVAVEMERWQDKVDGLQADLDSAVDTAFHRGAIEWTRLNYPNRYAQLAAAPKAEGK